MATYTDPLAYLSGVNSSAGDGRNFNEQWLNAFKGLTGQQLLNIDGSAFNTGGLQMGATENGLSLEAQIAAERQANALNAAGVKGGVGSGGGAMGTVNIGGQPFSVGWVQTLNNGAGGFVLDQVNDAGVAGRTVRLTTDASGNVTGNELYYRPGWDSTDTMMAGSVLGAAAAGTAAGAYGAAGTGTGAATGTAATGGAAATGTGAGSAGLIGGGTTAGTAGTAATGTGLGSSAGSTLGGMLASGATGTTAAGAGTAATTAGVGGLGAGAATSVGGALASAAGGGSGGGGASTGNWYDSLLTNAGNYLTSGQGIGTVLGGLLGAASSGDQTLTQTSSTSLNDPTAVNDALANYRALAGGSGDYTAAVNPYADASNPYLSAAIDAANADTVRNYNFLAPAKYSAGSSFGNSGLGFLEVNDRANVLSQLANTSATMNYQGYNQAATLADAYAGRQDAANQFNAGQRLQANQGLIGGAQALGSTTTQSSTAPGNIWASTLGGALIGSQLSNRNGIFGQTQQRTAT